MVSQYPSRYSDAAQPSSRAGDFFPVVIFRFQAVFLLGGFSLRSLFAEDLES